ncbi:MAG TPA: amidohydrolase family protein [Rhodothermales bacterium]|nr:amidohydrolase family protein [Rhodothermales bacterium]
MRRLLAVCLQGLLTAGAIAILAEIPVPSGLARDGMRHQPSGRPIRRSDAAHEHDRRPATSFTQVSFKTREGTFMSVDVAPDGTRVAFDLLGDIYLLPVHGGTAEAITRGPAWDQAPLFSIDGTSIYFISDRSGAKNIWEQEIGGLASRQVTSSKSDVIGVLNWTNDRRRIIAARGNMEIANAEVSLYTVDPRTGELSELQHKKGPWIDLDTFERLRPRIHTFSGIQSPEGGIYFSEGSLENHLDRFTVRMFSLDPATGSRSMVTDDGASYSEFAPQISPDGAVLAWFRQYDDRSTEIRIRRLGSAEERPLVYLQDADDAAYGASHPERPRYAFTPDGTAIVYWHAGKIWSASLTTGRSRTIPFQVEVDREIQKRATPIAPHPLKETKARIVRWPSMAEDGRWLVFSAVGYIWIYDRQSASVRRLTCSDDFEYMPSISPDGESVAYIAFPSAEPEYFSGRLMVVSREKSRPNELLAEAGATYLLPRWSLDGTKIAIVREYSTDSGTNGEFGWTPSYSGSFNRIASAPPSSNRATLSLSSRYVGFSPDGERLIYSYPTSQKQMVLMASDLDGDRAKPLAIADEDIIGIAPSPDLGLLLLTARDASLWLQPRRAGELTSISLANPSAQPVAGLGGYYASWTDRRHFVSSLGTKIDFHDSNLIGSSQSLHVDISIESEPQAVVFKHARLLTLSADHGVGPIVDDGAIVVRGNEIAQLGLADQITIPEGAAVIEVRGKTILPGFIDSHYHRIGGRNGTIGLSAFKLPNSSFNDTSAIAYGITTAWEPGGILDDGAAAAADLQRAGRMFGPRWTHSASGAIGYPWRMLRTYEDARRAITLHKILGVSTLKEYNTPIREQQRWLAQAARAAGLGIYSHVENFDGAMTRVVDGYSGSEHSYLPIPYFKDVAELLRKSGHVWTPNVLISLGNVSVVENGMHGPGETDREGIDASSSPRVSAREPIASVDSRRIRVARQVAKASETGVAISISGHNMPGSQLHTEMRYLANGGMSVRDILRAVTLGNAAKLGLDRYIGSLEEGKIADFLVLDHDPLIDISNTDSVRYTVQGGRVYDSKEQTQLFRNRVPSTCAP